MEKIQIAKAQDIAIAALQRLAQDETLFMRFSNLTGISAHDIQELAYQPPFLVAVLDFFLGHEPDLLAWAEADKMNPQMVSAARFALAPNDSSGFE